MKQPRKEHHRHSSQFPTEPPESGVEEFGYIPTIRQYRGRVKESVSSLQNKRAQMVIQAESVFHQVEQIEKQIDTLTVLAEEARALHRSGELLAYQARIRELEEEVSKLAYRYGLFKLLIDEIDAQLP